MRLFPASLKENIEYMPETYIKAVLTGSPQKIVIHLRSCLIQVKDTAIFKSVAVATGTKIHGHAALEFPCLRIIQ